MSKYLVKFLFVFWVLLFFCESCHGNLNENLVEAAHSGDSKKTMELLEKGADPNYRDSSGNSALLELCRQPVIDEKIQETKLIFENLVRRGADINLPDQSGNTPLFYSIESGNYELTVWLVNHGADVNKRNKNLQTPLFKAVSFVIAGVKEIRSMQFVRFLHQAGGDIFVKDKEGKNLMHASKDPSVTAWLIEQGLSPSLKDNYGKTPLDYSSAEIFKLRNSIAGYARANDQSKN